MAGRLKFIFLKLIFSIFLISFTVLLLERGWSNFEDPVEESRDVPHHYNKFHRSSFLRSKQSALNDGNLATHLPKKPENINLAAVVCGNRINDTIIMMKSALLFTSARINFFIMADEDNQISLRKTLTEWQTEMKKNFTFTILNIEFPVKSGEDEWRKLFKPCASQRLFIPTILDEVDSLIYVDTDVIFLRPLDDLWLFFNRMNSSQVAALTPEHEDFTSGWYNRFAKHPFYGPLGVNSGVMLMNLTRMREMKWQQLVLPIYEQYKYKITWGDQDIINILFHNHPDKLLVIPCEWNYRPDHCMYLSVCRTAEKNGISILHGNRGVFRSNKQPTFRAVYNVFEMFQFGQSLSDNLLNPLKEKLLNTKNTNCGKVHPSFTERLQRVIVAMPNR